VKRMWEALWFRISDWGMQIPPFSKGKLWKNPRLETRTGGYRKKCRAATFSSFIQKDAKTM
jgi:hypothetical protein